MRRNHCATPFASALMKLRGQRRGVCPSVHMSHQSLIIMMMSDKRHGGRGRAGADDASVDAQPCLVSVSVSPRGLWGTHPIQLFNLAGVSPRRPVVEPHGVLVPHLGKIRKPQCLARSTNWKDRRCGACLDPRGGLRLRPTGSSM